MEGLVLWPRSSGVPDSPGGTCTLVLQAWASGPKGNRGLILIVSTSVLTALGGRVCNRGPTLQVRKLRESDSPRFTQQSHI